MSFSESKSTEAKYGLPREVVFCSRCVMSNQRPNSSIEFRHSPARAHSTLRLDSEGICDACRYAEEKERIDWKVREEELLKLLDRHRRSDGQYDCIVPGSGGRDSVQASHLLKYKYGMNPLTVTWPPILYTEVGWHNFRRWIDVGGFDNISFNYNGRVHALLTRLAIENLLHPFQPFILGQKNLAPKIAAKMGIPLIFYGENEAEYGNPLADNRSSLRDRSYFSARNRDELYLGGVSIRELKELHGLTDGDIRTYLPVAAEEVEKLAMEVHYLGYYVKWVPQEAFYYAVEHTGFNPNPVRSEGTFTKYASLDDKIDGFHYYTTFIKFGLGRCSYEASHEIRNQHITRDEALGLVRRFEGEFPEKYFREVMDFIGMKPERFVELCDQFRSPHLWKKQNGSWKLRFTVNNDGADQI